jgi:VIT1/CCC1 family predicted Fe2+/Mn2+ transporter
MGCVVCTSSVAALSSQKKVGSRAKRVLKSALNIGVSYIVGGMIPLSPYFMVEDGITGLKYSAVVTLICLFIFGYFKSKLTGTSPWAGAVRVMIIGAIAASCAFGIA